LLVTPNLRGRELVAAACNAKLEMDDESMVLRASHEPGPRPPVGGRFEIRGKIVLSPMTSNE
jgi:hypothetical protein